MENPKFKKVLFCTDFSENADYAFEFALGIAKRDNGLLYILHVIPGDPNQIFTETVVDIEHLEEIQQAIEEDIDDKYKKHYLEKIGEGAKFEIVTKHGREDGEIIKFARQEKADLIVMGTHGRTGIKHVIFGSVAEKVLRRSPFPVFIIPDRERFEIEN